MKKIIVTVLSLVCLLSMTVAVLATTSLPAVVDEAQLLSDAEKTSLSQQAVSIQSRYDLDVVILTVNSTHGKSPRSYAESYYDQHKYADDGILLLIAMDERDWCICTTGKAKEIIPDRDVDRLGDQFIGALSDGAYYRDFSAFLDALPAYCDAYVPGKAIDRQLGMNHVLIALVIGVAIGGITIAVMRSAMNTAKAKYSATEYVKSDTFHPYGNFDTYLYSRVKKTPKQNNSSGGRSGGGGSRSHGGCGGKF